VVGNILPEVDFGKGHGWMGSYTRKERLTCEGSDYVLSKAVIESPVIFFMALRVSQLNNSNIELFIAQVFRKEHWRSNGHCGHWS